MAEYMEREPIDTDSHLHESKIQIKPRTAWHLYCCFSHLRVGRLRPLWVPLQLSWLESKILHF